MFDSIKNFLNKTIISFIKDNIKTFIFIVVFIAVCFLYNINNQYLNFALKRGVILEYSLQNNQTVNKVDIEKKLLKMKVKYTFVDEIDTLNQTGKILTSYDLKDVKNMLIIALPYKFEKEKQGFFNDVSDYIFDNYKDSKLVDVKPINDIYSVPFAAFNKFLLVLFTSIALWFIILTVFFDIKEILKSSKEKTAVFLKKQKEGFKNLISKTKEKGIGYFFKRILLDDCDSEKDGCVMKEILSTIIFVLVCVIVIRYFIGELRWIPSGSMRNTIIEHDRVFVEKLDFPKKEIKRGDILVFYPPEIELSNSPIAIFTRLSGVFCKDIAFIKRAVGMPGDKFEVKFDNIKKEFRVFINNKPLHEPYVNSQTDWTRCTSGMYCGPFIIPKDNYFMMGDNRGNSQDSRFWGFLSKDRIIGRATFMFYPIKRINVLKDKYLDLHEQKILNQTITKRYILNRYEFLYKI